MKTTALLIALGTIAGAALSAQPEGRGGPRGERPPIEDVAALLVADFDADGSGALDRVEFETALKEHQKHLARRGPRGGAQGKFDEANRPPRQPRMSAEERAAKRQERLTEAFTAADADQSGALNEAELATALETMRPARPSRGERGPQDD